MEWISVKERLPERDGHYLCAFGYEYESSYGFGLQKIWYCVESRYSVKDGAFGVSMPDYWMELPELPEVANYD